LSSELDYWIFDHECLVTFLSWSLQRTRKYSADNEERFEAKVGRLERIQGYLCFLSSSVSGKSVKCS
jgi:hypothetical protein